METCATHPPGVDRQRDPAQTVSEGFVRLRYEQCPKDGLLKVRAEDKDGKKLKVTRQGRERASLSIPKDEDRSTCSRPPDPATTKPRYFWKRETPSPSMFWPATSARSQSAGFPSSPEGAAWAMGYVHRDGRRVDRHALEVCTVFSGRIRYTLKWLAAKMLRSFLSPKDAEGCTRVPSCPMHYLHRQDKRKLVLFGELPGRRGSALFQGAHDLVLLWRQRVALAKGSGPARIER
jgi:hypothetical protein